MLILLFIQPLEGYSNLPLLYWVAKTQALDQRVHSPSQGQLPILAWPSAPLSTADDPVLLEYRMGQGKRSQPDGHYHGLPAHPHCGVGSRWSLQENLPQYSEFPLHNPRVAIHTGV